MSDSTSPVDPARSLLSLEVAYCDQLADYLRGGDTEFIQLGAGQSEDVTRIDLDGTYLYHVEMGNLTVAHSATVPGFRKKGQATSEKGSGDMI